MAGTTWIRADVALMGGDTNALWDAIEMVGGRWVSVDAILPGAGVVFSNTPDMVVFGLACPEDLLAAFDEASMQAVLLPASRGMTLDLAAIRGLVADLTWGRGSVVPAIYAILHVADAAAAQALEAALTSTGDRMGFAPSIAFTGRVAACGTGMLGAVPTVPARIGARRGRR